MGVLSDQIAAIRANDALTDDQKRAQIYAVKCNALFDQMRSGALDAKNNFLGRSFTVNGVDITCHAVGVTRDDPKRFVLDLTLTKGGVTDRSTYYVTNPPIIASDGSENLLKALGEMCASWAR